MEEEEDIIIKGNEKEILQMPFRFELWAFQKWNPVLPLPYDAWKIGKNSCIWGSDRM